MTIKLSDKDLYIEYVESNIIRSKQELEKIQQAFLILGMDIGPISLAIAYLEEALEPDTVELEKFMKDERS
jgi:hypothetical protein